MCFIFTTDAFVLSINSCYNTASDSVFLHDVKIKASMLRKLLSGVEVGNDYFRNIEQMLM